MKCENQIVNKFFIITTLFILLLLFCVSCNSARDNLNVPCKFLDSVNITDGSMDENGNILYDGILYKKENYGNYDYEFLNETYRQPVETHIRGCLCMMKPCVRICCPRGEYYSGGCRKNSSVYNLDITVALSTDGNETKQYDLYEQFGNLIGKPCDVVTEQTPDIYEEDAWRIFQDGIMQTGLTELTNLTKNQYCLNPKYNNITGTITIAAVTCFSEYYDLRREMLLPIGMVLSVPFLIATFLVYAILPELRNVHGKSLMCYLLGLTVGYSVLSYIQFKGGDHSIESATCRIFGYITYFSLMFAFFWLSVISFDLWWNFRGVRGISKFAERKKFLIYSAYAWCSSIFLISLCVSIDASSFISTNYQPGFGVDNCFLRKNKLTEFIYFYLPVMIIICFNSTFFTLTALKIRKVQNEMSKITAKEDSRRHQTNLDNEKAKFGLFLRLFIVMGVTWCMEAISWLIAPTSWVFFLFDLCNTIQGLVIFILFVFKQKVKMLLIKRWYIWRGIPIPKTGNSSGTTRSSNITMTSYNNNTEKSLITDVRD